MIIYILLLCIGLAILIWSAGKFVEGSASLAKHLGMSSLLIGMVIVGFGTSAPELVVSLFAAIQNNPGIALGNAFGSNIANIALILGVSSIIAPISVHSSILKKELPILSLITVFSLLLLLDKTLSRIDAVLFLLIFTGYMAWTIWSSNRTGIDSFAEEVDQELASKKQPLTSAIIWLITGLILLIASSRLLVWSAVKIAEMIGLSDLIIGLTIVAIGTSLPELASSIIASKKGEHDLALGNIIGSNLFNTLAVVGLAGTVQPFSFSNDVIKRDYPVMIILTLSIFLLGYGFRGRQGRINRIEGTLLLISYITYTLFLVL